MRGRCMGFRCISMLGKIRDGISYIDNIGLSYLCFCIASDREKIEFRRLTCCLLGLSA